MSSNNPNWEDLGKNIQNAVDRAVNSQNYQKLNETIRQAVNQAVDIGSDAVQKVADSVSKSQPRCTPAVRHLYGSTAGKTVLRIFQAIGGWLLSILGGFGLLGSFISQDSVDTSFVLAALIELAFLIGGICMIRRSSRTKKAIRHFKLYKSILGSQTHYPVKALADSIGKSESFARTELLYMFELGFFPQGHLDGNGKNLITSHETYHYYLQSKELAQQANAPAAEIHDQQSKKDPQLQEVLDKGNAFISQIRKCNDDIPGEEISEKISRIELLVQRIFDRAEAHPEILPDLKKLMDYYLPMTVKLLRAYADMDAQPIQGETIQASKKEIEASLNTLTLAFEKLLDSIFMDTAMDVSSDISVLNTLLAQEGLTGNDFASDPNDQ